MELEDKTSKHTLQSSSSSETTVARQLSVGHMYCSEGVAVLEACLSLARSGAIWANGQKFELSQDAAPVFAGQGRNVQ